MATRSSVLAWRIPGMAEPGGLPSLGSHRVGHDWATSLSLFTFMHWRRQWQPTPVLLPGRSHGWRSLVGCSPWGCEESDTTEWLHFHLLYNIVLVLPYINMNPPQVYMCSPSWTPLPPPSLYHPPGLSQCTSPKHPVVCIDSGLAIRFIYDIIHDSMPFSQIIPPSPSPTESKRLFYASVSLLLSHIQGYHYHLSKSIYMH